MRRFAFVCWTVAVIGLIALSAVGQPKPLVVTNVPIFADWMTGMPVDDLVYTARPFGSAAQPWLTIGNGGIPLSNYRADGWPAGDFGMFWVIRDYPSNVSWNKQGKGKLTWISGVRSFTAAPDGNSGTAVIDGNGGTLSLSITGTDPADPFRNLHIIPQGETGKNVWTDTFKNPYQYADIVRVMNWQNTNKYETAAPPDFAKRSLPGQIQTRDDQGVCIEYLCAFANQTNKDLWLCMPIAADKAYVQAYAQRVKECLNPNLKVYVELSNECWNPGFPQWRLLIAMAKADTRLTAPDDSGRGYQEYGMKSYDNIGIFKSVIGSSRVYGVGAGQGANVWLLRQALGQLESFYGKGSATRTFDVLSYANYYGSDYSAEVAANANPTSLLASMQANILLDRRDDPQTGWKVLGSSGFAKDYKAAQTEFGISRVIQYEGGPNIIDTVTSPTGQRNVINHAAHLAMKMDTRLGDLVKLAYNQDAAAGIDGVALFSGPVESWQDGQWGYWGMMNSNATADQNSPEYLAYQSFKGVAPQPPPIVPQPPQPNPTTKPATNPTSQPTSLKSVIMKLPSGTLRIDVTDGSLTGEVK